MGRGKNAALAVQMYGALSRKENWSPQDSWKGIAHLLLTCEIWRDGWRPFHDFVVFRESNDFKLNKSGGPNAAMRRAEKLTRHLANELGIEPEEVCGTLGQYFRHPDIRAKQPHNLVGHAFRSIVTEILSAHGSDAISYEEEVDPHAEFAGHTFSTRSENPRIDIVARKGIETVALLSVRWRVRHDRIDLPDEAIQYKNAATRIYPKCRFFAILGEFAPSRLKKVLDHAPPAHPHPSIDAVVHFRPQLITEGTGENGRTIHLKDIAWLIKETYSW